MSCQIVYFSRDSSFVRIRKRIIVCVEHQTFWLVQRIKHNFIDHNCRPREEKSRLERWCNRKNCFIELIFSA
jgi:hypothetical protein